ncbi:UTP--glucose-1-phosphate uridylyltransferase GalU [Methylophilaceae bacterium]|jgi:UTP--glucose-1-phosphate uridylyltransferase|nr:UTP--glucose-1-phosphate uridylyltransferase GalU [Methylophilaceae bacterium]NCV28207.1 UTP--glucose-1-phosphate uridylyltransferase [Nitrosomonadales bacterium]NCV38706.1 UTP--glucose-1-phosphate uridylyltransferase [Betaproteobacteria bacterium]MDC0977268.1 UTP--glucose-1-phosphate uridylyltransferase GalU [Methylophilaceae bacterium]NCW63390.1 UTP--glucose-1-phosphate uridylyltransferase [Betaproteobacteria bacterium]
MKKLRKIIFPVAGLGSRFLPATKATPKEMLPIVDKPLIQYAVEEAIEAGFKDLIFITGKSKRAITDHFDSTLERFSNVDEKKAKLMDEMNQIVPKDVSCIYIRQGEPLGLGHAILQAKPVVGEEPFAVSLADDLIDAQPGVLMQLVEQYNEQQKSVIAVQNVDKSESNKYGMIDSNNFDSDLVKLSNIIEKPDPEFAPSNLGVVGRYVFSNTLMSFLEKTSFGAGNEIQLTDGIKLMLKQEEVFAYTFKGKRYDCGSKLGYLMANIDYGIKNSEFGKELKDYIREIK